MVEVAPQDTMAALLVEVDAMSAAVQAVDGGDVQEALDLTRQAFAAYQNAHKFDDRVIACAMAYILGEGVAPFVPKISPMARRDQYTFEMIGHLWASWAANLTVERPLPEPPPEEHTVRKTGAIHRMALTYWNDAVQALIRGESSEARRCWRRALEVGSSHGTDSHPVVFWTYAASFFPRDAKVTSAR